MGRFVPLRNLSPPQAHSPEDVVIIFGEVKAGGYLASLVELLIQHKIKIIGSVLGSRDQNGNLGSLSESEILDRKIPVINVPIEFGFDLEQSQNGSRPIDQLENLTAENFKDIKLDWTSISESKNNALSRVKKNLEKFCEQAENFISPSSNVTFVHAMAGGVPRSPRVGNLISRVARGMGDQYLSSQDFLESEVGRFFLLNFQDVTADSFKLLAEATKKIRDKQEAKKKRVSYLAYGYHGNEIKLNGSYRWASSPYFQGMAKLHLEQITKDLHAQGVKATVFNCPEIFTQSSALFTGLELHLFQLIESLKLLNSSKAQNIISICENKLVKSASLQKVIDLTTKVFSSPELSKHMTFDLWPAPNSKPQMDLMISTSREILNMHADPKDLIKVALSSAASNAVAQIMLNESGTINEPVVWIGHDLVSKVLS